MGESSAIWSKLFTTEENTETAIIIWEISFSGWISLSSIEDDTELLEELKDGIEGDKVFLDDCLSVLSGEDAFVAVNKVKDFVESEDSGDYPKLRDFKLTGVELLARAEL